MPNGSPDTYTAPLALQCSHHHNEADNTYDSINHDPTCGGRCIFIEGHPSPDATTQAKAAATGTTEALTKESDRYGGLWQYAGGCCKCGTCHKWVKDWGIDQGVTG
jgi:hypothetical protein